MTYKDRKGVERRWEAVSRVGCDGVVIIVPVTREREVILIRQYRLVNGNYVMEFPAGLIEKGEGILEAARRELIEETGFDGECSVLLEGVISTGINAEKWTAVLAENARRAAPEMLSRFTPDDTEDIEVMRTPVSGLYEFLEGRREKGDLVDLRIYGLMELAGKKLGK